jgi:hypothetical protein
MLPLFHLSLIISTVPNKYTSSVCGGTVVTWVGEGWALVSSYDGGRGQRDQLVAGEGEGCIGMGSWTMSIGQWTYE